MSTIFSLIVERGAGSPAILDLERERAVIGSAEGCDLIATDRYVSRRHAELMVKPDGVFVTDLGSRNGTEVNGRRIGSDAVRLGHGDILALAGGRFTARLASNHQTETIPVGARPGGSPRRAATLERGAVAIVIDGAAVRLAASARQRRILEMLWASRGTPVADIELKRAGWPEAHPATVTSVSLRTQMSRLRSIVRLATGGEVSIAAAQGAGYILI